MSKEEIKGSIPYEAKLVQRRGIPIKPMHTGIKAKTLPKKVMPSWPRQYKNDDLIKAL